MTPEQFTTSAMVLITIVTVVYAFMGSMKQAEKEKGRDYATMLYGVWVEIFITFFPFAIYFLVDAFKNDVAHVLEAPELAVAAAVLSGQAVLKLVHQAIGMPSLTMSRERIVFLVVVGLLVFLLCVSTVALIAYSDPHTRPWFVGPLQLLLITFALPLYSALAGAAALLRVRSSGT
jgi:hypothetical protein